MGPSPSSALVPVLWVGLALLAVAGAADVISAVFRQNVQQRAVPDHLQGRLSGTFFAVVAGGPRLGDLETGVAAAIGGPEFAVWSGGLACVVGVGVLLWRVPELWADDGGGQPLSPGPSRRRWPRPSPNWARASRLTGAGDRGSPCTPVRPAQQAAAWSTSSSLTSHKRAAAACVPGVGRRVSSGGTWRSTVPVTPSTSGDEHR